jgi:hypothetical protein
MRPVLIGIRVVLDYKGAALETGCAEFSVRANG